MNQTEVIAYIDTVYACYKKERELERASDDWSADVLSDYLVFDVELKIAQFAVFLNHTVTIEGFTLEELLTEDNLEDEDGYDISVSELISNWISTTGGSIAYDGIEQEEPPAVLLAVIAHYENQFYLD